MAKDLIPPPSPAGRPSGDADAERQRAREREEAKQRQGGLWSRTTEPDPLAEAVEMADRAGDEPLPKGDSPYRSRFGLVLGALLGIAIATLAIGSAVYVGTTGNNGVPDGWSQWKPESDDGLGAAKEIATHVGEKYRLADDSQLLGVQAGPLEIDALGLNVPLEIAMKTAAQGGDIKFFSGDKGVLYTLNGLGPDGALPGKPTKERGLLVRREALELVLYTFRYVQDVDLIVTLLPPATIVPNVPAKKGSAAAKAPKAKQTQALFFRPGDLQPQLEIPLAATIPQRQTPRPETFEASEASRIETLTKSNLFGWSYQQAQNQKAFLVLERLPG